MFVLKRLYSRANSSRKYLKPSKLDPGVHHRKEALKAQPDDTEDYDFEQLESDFMSIDKTHREHLNEIYDMKEKEKFMIVRDKYFKEKYPNFLTWQDKDQIRYLHNSNPEEWDVEKLSEGFPALPEVIMKIVKGKWTTRKTNRIENHDRSALKNWEDFKSGKLENLPQELKEHLKKFTNRVNKLESFDYADVVKGNKPIFERSTRVEGEFSEIISSYEKLKNKNRSKETLHIQEKNSSVPDTLKLEENSERTTRSTRPDKNMVTLKALQSRIEKKVESGTELSAEEKLIVKSTSEANDEQANIIELEKENISEIIESRHKTGDQVGFVRKSTRDVSHLIYPEKISIPKDIHKRGYTYKLNDCYYDSDGEFLYRVPGMD